MKTFPIKTVGTPCGSFTSAKPFNVTKDHFQLLFSNPTVDPFGGNPLTTMLIKLQADNLVTELLSISNLSIQTGDPNQAPITGAVGTVGDPLTGVFTEAAGIEFTEENTAGKWTISFTAEVALFSNNTPAPTTTKTFTYYIDSPYVWPAP